MKKITLFALLLIATVASVQAQEIPCDECGITDENVALWREIDANCSGGLTVSDIVQFRRFVNNAQFGFPIIFAEDLDDFLNAQTDVNGDGVFDENDVRILQGLQTYFWITGNTSVHIDDLIACLQAVILGTCPA